MNFTMLRQSTYVAFISISLASCGGTATDSSSVSEYLNAINDTPTNLQDNINIDSLDNIAPSEPSNLRLTRTPFSNEVELTWNLSVDNVQVSGYRVYRDGVLQAFRTVNTYRDTTVSSGMNYTYYVEAVDTGENTSVSNVLDVETPIPTDTVDPTTPTGLSATNITSNEATISWNASTDDIAISGYRIYQNGVHIGTTVNSSFTINSLEENTSYSFIVEAYDSSNNSSMSNSLNVITLVQSETGARNVTLSWRSPTRNTDDSCIEALDGYILQYGNTPSSYNTSIDLALGQGDISCEQTDYDNVCGSEVLRCTYITEVLPAENWYFAVQAYDNSGNLSAFSNETLAILN